MMNAYKLLQRWGMRTVMLAKKHNVHPVPFVIVWIVTLALFPIAMWWVGQGLYAEVETGELILRVFVAWVLFQAPSLYVLVFGRNIPWSIIAVIVIGVLMLSAWRFGIQGVMYSVIFLTTLVVIKHTCLRRKERSHADF